MSRKKLTLLVALLLLLVFGAQGILFIRANSQTIDEAMHLAAGYSYLATKDFRIEPQNPPLIKELLALPLFLTYRLPFNPDGPHWLEAEGLLIGRHLRYKPPPAAHRMLALTRCANLFLCAILVALIAWWAYRLWGNRAAMLAIALSSLEPNAGAHPSRVT